MKKRVLLTGASGFVGRTLAPILLARGFEVCALAHGPGPGLPDGIRRVQADLTDPGALQGLERKWDYAIHLAGATIPSQFTGPAPLMTNLGMALNLLEHLRESRVLLVSSCHVYAPSSEVRAEDSPIGPQGLYGLSKVLVEQLASHYRHALDVRIARPFNHLGPGSPPSLVVPSLLRRLMAAPADPSIPLAMQGRDTFRDFIDVRDVAEAYLAILETEDPAARLFNVCTGRAVRISDVLQAAMAILGRHRPVHFSGDPNSSDDNDFIVGDPGLLRTSTGWRSRFPMETSLATMILQPSDPGSH